jgi:hypothetical protein
MNMTREQPEALPQTTLESASETLVNQADNEAEDAGSVPDTPLGLQARGKSTSTTHGNDDEEQALESHEVIELQTFSERKAWIEEKIRVSLSDIP